MSKLNGRLGGLARASLGYTLGIAAAAVGAGLEWGLPVGLMAGGTAAAVSCLFLGGGDDGGER